MMSEVAERAKPQVIRTVENIPPGRLVSAARGEFELNEARQADFAVLDQGATGVVLLVAEGAHGSPHYYEIQRRLINAKRKATVAPTTKDLIKIVYERDSEDDGVEEDKSEAEELIDRILEDANVAGTSDIHIETRGVSANVFFRIHGKRIDSSPISKKAAVAFGRVLYNVKADAQSKDTAWDQNDATDCVVEHTTKSGKQIQLRFSSSPIYPSGNFHIVIRLLQSEATIKEVTKIGYLRLQLAMVEAMAAGSNGLMVFVGPTNSGKSTTLQSILHRAILATNGTLKVITIEEPVELVTPGTCQISVGKSKSQNLDGNSSMYTKYLRGSLRQDPDIVMVGEIRDKDGAEVTRDLVLAGRKVFATLHAFNVLGAFIRLREMGLPWDVLTSPGFIAGVVYQRLLPTLCANCKVPFLKSNLASNRAMRARLEYVTTEETLQHVHVRGEGCDACKRQGISGRTIIAETLIPDRHLLRLLSCDDIIGAESYWRTEMPTPFRPLTRPTGDAIRRPATALQHALNKMTEGIVSPEDIEREIEYVNYDFATRQDKMTQADLEALIGFIDE